MRRREFIALVGGVTATWPLATHAQQPAPMRRIGVLVGYGSNADDPYAKQVIQLFQEAMQSAGWTDGKNIHLDYTFAAGQPAKTEAAAAALVALAPELIYATGLLAAQALKQKTRAIPIVFTQVADPVGFGLVASLSHPGGNMTGFMAWELSIGGKWIELLREIAPNLRRIGILYNPDTAAYAPALIASAKASAGHDVAVIDCPVHADRDIDVAIASLGGEPNGGLLGLPEVFVNTHQDQIIGSAARFKLPVMLPFSGATRRGALISYTYEFAAMIQAPVGYIDRILKGDSPRNLPVQAPTKFELSLNLKTAKALGLTVPNTVLVSADEVIE